MKKENLIVLVLCLSAILTCVSCNSESSAAKHTADRAKFNTVASPADEKISKAKIAVEKYPDVAKSHLQLAAGYLQKVRETGDYSINRFAEDSISRALKLDPNNFEARAFQTQIYLSEHEFAKALALAQEIDKLRPENPLVFAAKTDALTELGRYDEAVQEAQKFVDTRPNALSYSRVAHLRALYGDTEGAIEARTLAIRMGDPQDRETYAWYHIELGKEYFNTGNFERAEMAFDRALEILPEYHWALAGKGKVLAANGNFEKAAEIYERLRMRVPQAGREIFLGDLYMKLGREDKAEKIYEEVAAREKAGPKGDMHRVALLWADQGINLGEALEVARKDREINNDLLASDTYAWTLYKTGDYKEAKKQMESAMRLNSKNALFYYHLGMIEYKLGNKAESLKNLQRALATNPSFDLLQAEIAQKTINQLKS